METSQRNITILICVLCCWLCPSRAVMLGENSTSQGGTVRICFGLFVNFAYFNPKPSANLSVELDDLDRVDMDVEEFHLYFSGLEVETIMAVVL